MPCCPGSFVPSNLWCIHLHARWQIWYDSFWILKRLKWFALAYFSSHASTSKTWTGFKYLNFVDLGYYNLAPIHMLGCWPTCLDIKELFVGLHNVEVYISLIQFTSLMNGSCVWKRICFMVRSLNFLDSYVYMIWYDISELSPYLKQSLWSSNS